MRPLHALLFALAPVCLASGLNAQAINIDVGPNLILWPEPMPAYGAGAAQPGQWNAVKDPFVGQQLLGLNGALTAVSVSSNISSSFTWGGPTNLPAGDDYIFTADGQNISSFGPTAVWTFSGLADGSYDVYTYCWAPENSGTQTDVWVGGAPATAQSVGGFWAGSPHAQGVTYALHTVAITGGVLTMEAGPTLPNTSGAVLGFQLVPASLFTNYCFGDGTTGPCPCGNLGALGEGCRNSSGSGVAVQSQGTNSVGSDDMTFTAQGMPAGTSALLFAGNQQVNGGAGAIFGDGLRCAGGPVQRLGVRSADAGGSATWGPGIIALGGWSSGDTRDFQVWYRDNSPQSPCGALFNTSHGVETTFQP